MLPVPVVAIKKRLKKDQNHEESCENGNLNFFESYIIIAALFFCSIIFVHLHHLCKAIKSIRGTTRWRVA